MVMMVPTMPALITNFPTMVPTMPASFSNMQMDPNDPYISAPVRLGMRENYFAPTEKPTEYPTEYPPKPGPEAPLRRKRRRHRRRRPSKEEEPDCPPGIPGVYPDALDPVFRKCQSQKLAACYAKCHSIDPLYFYFNP